MAVRSASAADSGGPTTNPVTVAQGGTGDTSLTAHGVLIGEGTGQVVATAAMTDGQLLVGQTAADPAPKTMSGDGTLTAGGVLSVTATHLASALPINQGGTASTTAAAALTALGAQAAGGLYANQTLLTAASGNFTVPSGVTQLLVLRQAAGGGGGGTGGTTAASAAGGTSGGFDATFMTVTPAQVIAYTIGGKGTGGASGANNGNAGGDITFGTLPTLKGGLAGGGSASGNVAGITGAQLQAIRPSTVPVAGTAVAFSAFINSVIVGAVTGTGGTGGFSPWGIPGAGGTATANGASATGYGAGGGGGSNAVSGAATSGGDGAPGAIVVLY